MALEFEEVGENGSRKLLNQTLVTRDTQIASQSAPVWVSAQIAQTAHPHWCLLTGDLSISHGKHDYVELVQLELFGNPN